VSIQRNSKHLCTDCFEGPLLCQSAAGCTDAALALAENQLTDTVAYTSTSQFPNETDPTNGNKWNLTDSTQWTSGFFPGWLWFMYEETLSDAWFARAQAQTASMHSQDTNASTHDIGFKMLGSFGNAYRITRDPVDQQTIVTAANAMATQLYRSGAGVFDSWPFFQSDQHITVIIDNMMNLELPFLAAQYSGNQTWYNMAISHALKTMENHVRPDGSTFQVVQYNSDGTVYDKLSTQGAGTNTTWSRGQAWGIYGFTMVYRYTKDSRFLTTAQQLADYFINNLPPDYVPYWDFSQNGTAPRDSSAAAIAAAGLLELTSYVAAPSDQSRYRTAALNIQTSLSSPAYLGVRGQTSGILLHGSANVPADDSDKSLIYGDYYFLQSCYRAKTPPAAPTSLSAIATSSNEVNLSWDAEPGAIRYSVKRSSTSGGPYTILAPPPVLTTNSYTDGAVVQGSNYYYVVSASGVAGESPNSPEATATIYNPVPSISSISPTNIAAGTNFTLTVNGGNFLAGSVVNFGGKAEPTGFVSSTQLTASVEAGDLAIGGSPAVTVTNPAPSAGPSSAMNFTVDDFAISAPAAASVKAGNSTAVTVTVSPSNANGFANPIALSISGLPSGAAASFSRSSIVPGPSPATTTLTITTAAQSSLLRFLLLPERTALQRCAVFLIIALCTLLSFRISRIRLASRTVAAAAAALLLFDLIGPLSGCGGGKVVTTSTPSNPPSPPTPTAQNYSVTITAQSGSDTKSITLTLTVQ
jgi:unsaturated chondroitin disaccharide hydrolase